MAVVASVLALARGQEPDLPPPVRGEARAPADPESRADPESPADPELLADPEPAARVEAFRAGSAGQRASGLLVRLVARTGGEGAELLHATFELPALVSRVHLVEERRADGSRSLVYRETTGPVSRSLRLDRPLEGDAVVVVHGEGTTQRRWTRIPSAALGPLERLEAERVGAAALGTRLALEPSTGRVRVLITGGSTRPLAGRCGPWLRVYVDRDRRGAIQAARLFVGTRLVAWQPSAGSPLARALAPQLFDQLREPAAGDAAGAAQAPAPEERGATLAADRPAADSPGSVRNGAGSPAQ